VWRFEALYAAADDLRARGVSQQRQLIQRILGSEAVALAAALDCDEIGAFDDGSGGVQAVRLAVAGVACPLMWHPRSL
jgi:hypothetical protein